MRRFLRILSLSLALVLAVSSFSVAAYAAEEVQVAEPQTLEFEITSEMPDEGYIAVPMSVIDQTFTMTTSHRGADRTYSGTELVYIVTITGADGSDTDNTVVVALHDYNNATAIKADSVNANGSINYFSVPIVTNRVYYFRYTKVSGTTQTLSVRMQITSN